MPDAVLPKLFRFGRTLAARLLTRRNLTWLASLVVAVEIAGLATGISFINGSTVSYDRPRSDFVSFYAAGALAEQGKPDRAYVRDDHYKMELSVAKRKMVYNYFYYPPVFLMLCALLAEFRYIVALFSFQLVTLGAALFVVRETLRDRSWTILAPLLAFPPVFWNFFTGQNAYLTAALFGGALLLLRTRQVLAGILIGALCYKPHLGLLIPIALAAGGYWRAFAAAAATVAGLILLSLAVFGPETWQAYLLSAKASQATYESGNIYFLGFTNLFGALRTIRADISVSYAAQGIVIFAGAAWTAYVWSRRDLGFALKAATLAAATPVVAPVSLFYDLMLSGIALAWLLRDAAGAKLAAWQKGAIALLYLSTIFAGNMGPNWFFPAPFLAAHMFFAVVLARGVIEINGTRLAYARN